MYEESWHFEFAYSAFFGRRPTNETKRRKFLRPNEGKKKSTKVVTTDASDGMSSLG